MTKKQKYCIEEILENFPNALKNLSSEFNAPAINILKRHCEYTIEFGGILAGGFLPEIASEVTRKSPKKIRNIARKELIYFGKDAKKFYIFLNNDFFATYENLPGNHLPNSLLSS